MSTNHVSLIFSSRLFTDAVNNWNVLRPVVEEWILIWSTGEMTYLDTDDVSLIQQRNAILLMQHSDDVTHSVRSIELLPKLKLFWNYNQSIANNDNNKDTTTTTNKH